MLVKVLIRLKMCRSKTNIPQLQTYTFFNHYDKNIMLHVQFFKLKV